MNEDAAAAIDLADISIAITTIIVEVVVIEPQLL